MPRCDEGNSKQKPACGIIHQTTGEERSDTRISNRVSLTLFRHYRLTDAVK